MSRFQVLHNHRLSEEAALPSQWQQPGDQISQLQYTAATQRSCQFAGAAAAYIGLKLTNPVSPLRQAVS